MRVCVDEKMHRDKRGNAVRPYLEPSWRVLRQCPWKWTSEPVGLFSWWAWEAA